MIVKLSKAWKNPQSGKVVKAGESIDLDDGTAGQLITAGYATESTETVSASDLNVTATNESSSGEATPDAIQEPEPESRRMQRRREALEG